MADRIKMIHGVTGTIMLVPAALAEEFIKAGHKPAETEAPAVNAAEKPKAKKAR